MNKYSISGALATALIALALSSPAWSEDDENKESLDDTMNRISYTLQARHPAFRKIDLIQPSKLPGFFEFIASGTMYYVTEDSRYVIEGHMIDLFTNDNLTKSSLAGYRRKRLAELPDDKTIVFAPKSKPRHTITVATDTSCGYCRKFHQEIPRLNEAGIKVRYVLFPRGGLDTNNAAYKTMTSVWCAEDKAPALTRAKSSGKVDSAVCKTPIAEHYQLSQDLGVRGTPSIFTPGGDLIPGHMPADQLIDKLNTEGMSAAGNGRSPVIAR